MKEEGKRSKSASPKVTPGPETNGAGAGVGVKMEKRKQEGEDGEDDLAKRAKIEGATQAATVAEAQISTEPSSISEENVKPDSNSELVSADTTIEDSQFQNPAQSHGRLVPESDPATSASVTSAQEAPLPGVTLSSEVEAIHSAPQTNEDDAMVDKASYSLIN